MNTVVNMYPDFEQLREDRRALDRKLRLRQQIGAARAARRSRRPSRFAVLTAHLHRTVQPRSVQPCPCGPLLEDC